MYIPMYGGGGQNMCTDFCSLTFKGTDNLQLSFHFREWRFLCCMSLKPRNLFRAQKPVSTDRVVTVCECSVQLYSEHRSVKISLLACNS